jgi:hypothetical protein
MHRLKILTAAAALLVTTPVVAQELRGPDPVYADGYGYGYDPGYDNNYQRNDFWPGRAGSPMMSWAARSERRVP